MPPVLRVIYNYKPQGEQSAPPVFRRATLFQALLNTSRTTQEKEIAAETNRDLFLCRVHIAADHFSRVLPCRQKRDTIQRLK